MNTAPYRITHRDGDADDARVLLCIDHSPVNDRSNVEAWRVRPGLPHLRGPQREWWLSDSPVTSAQFAGLSMRSNDSVAMGQMQIPESALVADTAAASEHLFAATLDAVRDAGFPHLLRTWIIIGDIHRGEGDAERYRQFCVGRARVLSPARNGDALFPAATVIGRRGGGMTLYFIAARQGGAAVENPRQTSAYDYPSEYGPQPPSFVRALRSPWQHLLVSGTAAVVGHASAHPGDCAAQAKETRRNVDALLHAAAGDPSSDWRLLSATAYLRRAGDITAADALHMQDTLCVLQGDICRRELMIECEAVMQQPRSDSA